MRSNIKESNLEPKDYQSLLDDLRDDLTVTKKYSYQINSVKILQKVTLVGIDVIENNPSVYTMETSYIDNAKLIMDYIGNRELFIRNYGIREVKSILFHIAEPLSLEMNRRDMQVELLLFYIHNSTCRFAIPLYYANGKMSVANYLTFLPGVDIEDTDLINYLFSCYDVAESTWSSVCEIHNAANKTCVFPHYSNITFGVNTIISVKLTPKYRKKEVIYDLVRAIRLDLSKYDLYQKLNERGKLEFDWNDETLSFLRRKLTTFTYTAFDKDNRILKDRYLLFRIAPDSTFYLIQQFNELMYSFIKTLALENI